MSERRFWQDDKDILKPYATNLIDTDFPLLGMAGVRINWTWVDPPEEDSTTGRVLQGRTRKLSPRERDLYGYDCMISISSELWGEAIENEREKLIWHELNHIVVEEDTEEGGFVTDKADRLKITLRKHDLVLDRFADELKKYGTSPAEREMIDHINGAAGIVVATAQPAQPRA